MIPPDFSIEYPFITLPYNCAVKQFKHTRKTVEKEMSQVLNSIITLKNQEKITKDHAKDTINNLIGRLNTLKRKLNQDYIEQDQIYESCKKRIQHLGSIQKTQKEDQNFYHQQKLKRLIIDYLIREGHFKTAKKIIQVYKIEPYCDLDLKVIDESNKIIQDLQNKQIDEAMKWCQANKSKLQKINSDFEFKLFLQQYFEIIKKDKIKEAVSYMQKNSMNYKNKYFKEIKIAMGCIAAIKEIDKYPNYKYYFEEERWNDIIKIFKQENYNVFSITSQPLLNITLNAGLSCLKTSYCCDKQSQQKDKCPVCQPEMQQLSEKIPSTQRMVSSLICRISGEIMDEHNPPVMLPNCQVFSQNGLIMLADKSQNGNIKCPITQQEYKLSDAIKIYLS